MKNIEVDLLIIGAGPAGLGAALAAGSAGVHHIIILDRMAEPGGILQQCIHNGFGLRRYSEELTGPEYAGRDLDLLQKQAGVKIHLNTAVLEIEPGGSGAPHQIIAASPQDGMVRYQARAVVLAMGCRERPRGAVNIPGFRPAGIYTAGTVQRLMNIEGFRPGNRAVILGSGDIGLIMARRLTLEGIQVPAVLELLPYSSGLTRNLVQCLEDYQIPLYLNHTVIEVLGEGRVTGVKVAPVNEKREPIPVRSFTLDCDTLVLSVGLIPENELSRMAGIKLDPATSGSLVGPDYQTSIPGIFACGNVLHVHDLVDDVSAESAVAGAVAAAFVQGRTESSATIGIKPGRNIRSVVPQRIAPDQPVTLYIRPAFPEQDVTLRAGKTKWRQRVVTPGETIRITVGPEQTDGFMDFLPLSLEREGDSRG